MAEYRTIGALGEDEFTEKKSRFIGHIAPVETEEDAIAFINEMRAKYRDASHNVYAYSLRENQIKRASDDGEPQGTGGVPVLNVLNGNGLTDVCCVVTRYFGGTLLGVGGLVRAYTEGAKIALAATKIKIMAECADIRLCSDYSAYGKIEHYINENGITVLNTEFGENVTVLLRLRTEDVLKFENDITELTAGRINPEIVSKGCSEI